MKSPKIQLLCLATVMLPYAVSAQVDTSQAISQAVTFTLTETYTAPGLLEKDGEGKLVKDENNKTIPDYWNEYTVETYKGEDLVKSVSTEEWAAKMGTAKISNKEILEELKSDGVIQSITGYAISYIDIDDGASDGGFYLTKKGAEPISIDQYLDIGRYNSSYAVGGTWKRVLTDDYVKETYTESETGSEKSKESITINFTVPRFSAQIAGIGSFGSAVKTFGKGEDAYTQTIPAAGKISSVSGGLTYAEELDVEDVSVLEGNISLAAGVPVPVPAASNNAAQ